MEINLEDLQVQETMSIGELGMGVKLGGGGGSSIQYEDDPVYSGFVKYNEETGLYKTITPDDKVSLVSDNIVKNSAVAEELDTISNKIEDVEAISKGLQKAKSFMDYATLVEIFNGLSNDVYTSGQIFNIATTKVPDLWVYGVAEESVPFTYTSDADLANLLDTNGTFQVGYYVFGAMETGKVDLEDYMKKTDIKATQLEDGSYSLTINTEV